MNIPMAERPANTQPDYKIAPVNDIEVIQPLNYDVPWPFYNHETLSPVHAYEDEEVPVDIQTLTAKIQQKRLAGIDPSGIINFCLDDNGQQHHCTGVIVGGEDGYSLWFCLSHEFPGS